MPRFENVAIVKQANVYFDGKCVSHTVVFPDGTKKTVGVILPSTLTFNTSSPERMEGVAGRCEVRIADAEAWIEYSPGQSFDVPGGSSFEIRCREPYHYVCHFG